MLLRLTVFLGAVVALSACGSHSTGDVRVKVDSLSVSAGGGVDTAFRTLHVRVPFGGAYVNEEYVDKIRANRSPREDQDVEKSCIEIPDSTLEKTSWIYSFHEGGPTKEVVNNGGRFILYDSYDKRLEDTLEPVGTDRLRIGKLYFRKLKAPDLKKSDWGILEEILFGGKYQTPDGREVVFGLDGSVKGLDSVAFYEPVVDYTGDIADYDRIEMGGSPGSLRGYAVRFDKDTLLINRVECLAYDTVARECSKEVLGEVLWKLRKVQ